jgi:hypothetical protein
MKNIVKQIFAPLLFLAVIGGVMSSCEDMLKEKPYDFISTIEDSNTGADQYVMGVYSFLLDDMFRWDQFPMNLNMDCDYATGPSWSLGTFGVGNFLAIDDNNPVDATWGKSYTLIHRANNAIENIEVMKNATDVHKANTIGELKFLKAYAYFLLVRAYGDVPIFYQSVNKDPNFHQPRKPITEVYAHIIDLLKDAESGMYKNTDGTFKSGRASAGAAASLLAKVYLTIGSASAASGQYITVKGGTPYTGTGDDKVYTDPVAVPVTSSQVAGYEDFDSQLYFGLARDKAKEVIDGVYGAYDLLPYDQLWAAASRDKVEHIFSIQPKAGDAKYGLRLSAYYTGNENAAGVIVYGLFHGCRDHWYKLFENNDLRIVDGVMHQWRTNDHVSWNGGAFYPNNKEYSIKARGYYVDGADTIYNDPSTGVALKKAAIYDDGRDYVCDNTSSYIAFLTKYFNASDRTQERTDVPFPILRFADVLLIYAEASNEVSDVNGAAVDALNRVRVRSNASMKSAGDFADKAALRSFVLEERARELALEGDRRWDLIRWGIYLPVMNAIGGQDEVGVRKEREAKHLLFPIPSDEILSNKAITENNPGWN